MTYITSTATNNGEVEIEVYFKQSMNADIAAVNVQNISLKRVYGSQTITRFNLFASAAINGAPNFGYSSGDAISYTGGGKE